MQAEIITIGDEILIGQIVDTNSAWMAKELNKVGIDVSRINSISDQKSDIINSLEESLERVSLVLMTGGLGPTNDDITKKTLSDYFGMNLIEDARLFKRVKERLAGYGIPMNKFNREQALIPDKARIIDNNFGSAPCMWFEKNGKVVISMPGVPFEMKGIMQEGVLKALQQHFSTPAIVHKTIMTEGIGESLLAEMLIDWEGNLPDYMHLAYLPSPGQVRLRISTKGESEDQLKAEINEQIELLNKIIPNNIFAYDDMPIEQSVAELLLEQGMSLGTAESCTGGYIAHLISSHAGSSRYFKGSVVSYSNEIKENVLKVKFDDLEKYGAVSQPVVEQMAKGARELLNVDYALATSGIAGPDGGTEEKPVGTIWIAMASKNGVISKQLSLYKARERNIRVSALKVLGLLLHELKKKDICCNYSD